MEDLFRIMKKLYNITKDLIKSRMKYNIYNISSSYYSIYQKSMSVDSVVAAEDNIKAENIFHNEIRKKYPEYSRKTIQIKKTNFPTSKKGIIFFKVSF